MATSTNPTRGTGRPAPARRADRRGFTLVELLVVIVILGILAAVVVFAVGGATGQAQTNACAQERGIVEAALESYRAQTNVYPDAAADLTTGPIVFLRESPSWHTVGSGDGSVAGDGTTCPV